MDKKLCFCDTRAATNKAEVAPMKVLTFDSQKRLAQAQSTMASTSRYTLLHFSKAASKLQTNDAHFMLHDGCMLCLPEPTLLHLDTIDAAVQGSWISFTRAERDQLLIDSYSLFCPHYGSRLIDLAPRTQARVMFLIAGLEWLATHPSPHLKLEETWVLQILVETIDGSINEKTDWGSLAHPQLQRFFQAVEKDFRTCHQVDAYARRVGASSRTLLRMMRDTVGITPKDFIAYRLNTEAKRLLISTHTPTQQIGFDLGFATAEYFYSFFKRMNKLSPADFRKCLNIAPTVREP